MALIEKKISAEVWKVKKSSIYNKKNNKEGGFHPTTEDGGSSRRSQIKK